MNVDFIKEYQEKNFKDSSFLPAELKDLYTCYACLKDTEEKQIYIIKNKENNKLFILKCISKSCPESADHEYHLLCNLEFVGCPGLPKAIGLYHTNNKSCLLEEYIHGTTVFDHIEAGYNFTMGEIFSVGLQICKILSIMHKQDPPVIHRDISPKNILLSKDGSITLIDLGIARKFAKNKSDDTVYIGTASSAPPEQFGYGQTDIRSDIYSIGILLYYLSTSNFDVKSLSQCHLPRSFKKIIKKCTQFSPKKRYQRVENLYRRLKKLSEKPEYIRNPIIILRKYRKLQIVCIMLVLLLSASGLFILHEFNVNSYYTAEVEFKSPLIEKAVRQELSLPDQEAITREMLKLVTRLYICGDQIYGKEVRYDFRVYSYIDEKEVLQRGPISTLEDLSAMPYLSELALPSQNISDLAPIKKLHLKKLNLGSNNISDLSIVKNFSELSELYIGDNPVSDLNILTDLKQLKYLNIDTLSIPDLNFLNSLNLDTFSCMTTTVENKNYSPLLSQTGLRVLDTMGLDELALPYVNQLTSLKILKLYSCRFTSLQVLNQVSGLNELHLAGSGVISLKGLDAFPELTWLGLEDTRVNDLTPIPVLKKLTGLGIIGTQVADYTPIRELPLLDFVNCSEEQRALIYGN